MAYKTLSIKQSYFRMFQKDNLRDVEIVSDEFLREFSLRWICYIVMLQVCGNGIGFLSAPLILQASKDLLSIVKFFIYTHCHRKVYLHIFQFQAIGRSTNGSTIRLGVSMKTMILLGLMIMFTTCCQISAVCTPFTYTRGSACSENLAASTFPACSSMNLTFERGFCELQNPEDLIRLESMARVLGRETVKIWGYFRHIPRFSTIYLSNAIIIFDKSFHSLAVGIPDKYERDSRDVFTEFYS